jgi:hypothetical protein
MARALALAGLLIPLFGARPPAGARESGHAASGRLRLDAESPARRARPADYTKYHTYAELTAELQRLVRAHPEIAKLVPIGESLGGRTIWAVEIAKAGGAPVAERPALLIVANLEGDQLIGSELALFTVEWLLTQYAGNPAVKQRVDEQAFLIVPRST